MKERIEVILFDLGGVLVELGDYPVPPEWLPGNDGFTLAQWFSSETALLFEKGQIPAEEFSRRFKKELAIQASIEQIMQSFSSWPIGLYAGAHELLTELGKSYRLAVLSNTNEIHWPRITQEFSIPAYFEHVFSSHLLHCAKPEQDIFKHVIKELKMNPRSILFLDDNLANVNVSRQLGMQGFHVQGIKQVKQVLDSIGILQLKS